MTTAIAPDGIEVRVLENEHHRVREGLFRLREAIAGAHRLRRSDWIDHTARALAWLRRDLLPHAAWEEAWLYPHLDTLAETAWATRALRFEHEQIRELATALETEFAAAEERWSPEQAFRLLVPLTRLETLITSHLAQEQWFIGPLLERAQPER